MTPCARAAATRTARLSATVHDNQWLLGWAVEDFEIKRGHFVGNVRWLAGLLAARDYPAARLARDLEIAAVFVGEAGDGPPPAGAEAPRRRACRGADPELKAAAVGRLPA
jgi:hypothetical protein